MQQAKTAVQAANLAPAAGAKVIKMQTVPAIAPSDNYPAPPPEFYRQAEMRPVTWFAKIMGWSCNEVYCFHPDGRHGFLTVDSLDEVTVFNAMQYMGWRFLSLSERAKQAVPIPFDNGDLNELSADEIRWNEARLYRENLAKFGRIPDHLSYLCQPPYLCTPYSVA